MDDSRPKLSSAQTCHTDVLMHCIFAFLALAELVRVLRTCRVWLSAALKEKPRGVPCCLVAGLVAKAPSFVSAANVELWSLSRVLPTLFCAAPLATSR